MSDDPLLPRTDHTTNTSRTSADAAVDLIRNKVNRAYLGEPDAAEELAEVKTERILSKHQQYMQELSASGKNLAEIQTAWHHYYVMLPDNEKHEVWQEFYAANQHTPYQKLFQKQAPVHSRMLPVTTEIPQPTQTYQLPQQTLVTPVDTQTAPQGPMVTIAQSDHLISEPVEQAVEQTKRPARKLRNRPQSKASAKAHQVLDSPSVASLKHKIVDKVSAGGKLKIKHHFQSLLFGLGTGMVVVTILLFSFFNEYIIAPFIQPSRKVSATPIILSDTQAASSSPQVIIPKINVQAPLNFSLTSNDENGIETALQDGVVHYPSTVKPGQNGNAAFFGHSSNNIFNPGHYKFIFTLLHTLTTGDTFYISYNGKTYGYQVFAREVVPPSQVSVLNDSRGKTATATLITCDPPGTSNNRLVVWGEQISPAVTTNGAGQVTAPVTSAAPTQLASNGPSLWTRLIRRAEFWR